MLSVESIRKSWNESGRFRSVYRTPAIESAGLLLGAGTCLVRMVPCRDGSEALAVEEEKERLLALLAVVKPDVPAGAVDTIRRASDAWSHGEHGLAAIHLALARFSELDDGDAYRLYMADGLLSAGLAPSDLVKALDLSPGAIGLGGHGNDEARVPGGNGRASGEWTSVGGSGEITAVAARKKPVPEEYKPGDPNKFFDTLEPQVHALAQRLNIDENWILGLAAYESSWLCLHNRGLNNPLGVTYGGGDDVNYPSIDAAIAYWEQHFGPAVRSATSAEDFIQRLYRVHYNTKNKKWSSTLFRVISSVRNRLPEWKSQNGAT